MDNPRKLVTNAAHRLWNAIEANKPEKSGRYLLMNTTGNRNRDLNEPILFLQKYVIGLLRLLLPPHVDNEKTADYLRTQVGQDNQFIEWVAVRPDSLIKKNSSTLCVGVKVESLKTLGFHKSKNIFSA